MCPVCRLRPVQVCGRVVRLAVHVQVLSPREAMFQGVLDMPALWGPVLAALLHGHAEQLPQGVLLEWQRLLLPLLQQEFGFAGQMDAATTGRLLWLLRSVQGLAVVWPSQLQGLALEAEAGAAVKWKVGAALTHWPD